MSSTTEIILRQPAVKAASRRGLRPQAGVFAMLRKSFRRWRLRLQTERRLNGLDDWMLKDIGISRSEIGYVAREASRDLK